MFITGKERCRMQYFSIPIELALLALLFSFCLGDEMIRHLPRHDCCYVRQEMIAKGSQAKVYQALPYLPMAIKSMKVGDECTEAEVRFLKEFGRSKRYRGVPRLFDLIETRKHVHIVMQYFEGTRLSNWRLSSRHSMRADQLRSYEDRLMLVLYKVLAVLHMVHTAGQVHLDLKPSNILVDRHENVMVIDFGGICLDSSDHSDLQEIPGKYMYTRQYRAPELGQHRKAGYASDIYSVGCIALRLVRKLTGSITELLPRLDALIKMTMEEDPELRPSAKHLLLHDIFQAERQRFTTPDDDICSVAWTEKVVSLTGPNKLYFHSLQLPKRIHDC